LRSIGDARPITIIVPFRNDARSIRRCLQALASQRYEGLVEITLIDRGATDGSADIASSFPGMQVLHTDHPSPYAARNLAARDATGSILVFTEANCVVEPDWVLQHVLALEGEGASVSIGRIAPERTTWMLDSFDAYERHRDEWSFKASHWRHYFGRPTNLAVRRDRFLSHGPFEEVLRGADSSLVQRIARELSCAEITYCPTAIVRHADLRGVRTCLQQRFRFSWTMATLRSSHSAPLALDERLRIFRETIKQERYGALRAAALAIMLVLGVLAFKAGSWRARVQPAPTASL